jgi:hypothetical protein
MLPLASELTARAEAMYEPRCGMPFLASKVNTNI